MLFAKLRHFFSQGTPFKIKVNQHSQLKKYLRKSKSQAEVAWQKKMRYEWVMILFASMTTINILYNSFPQIWLSHNLFMPEEDSMVMQIKAEVEKQYRDSLKNRSDKQR